ncbi:unnamed protein product [Symbiodinium sp. CCMP2456]|nr:unnamed protein product [Symbiodinium sp. CCMP2456]
MDGTWYDNDHAAHADDENDEGWNAWTDLPGQPAGHTAHEEEQTVSDEETAVALNALEVCDFENFHDAAVEAVQLQCAAHMVMGKAGRGKGLSGGKGKKGFPVVRSYLSVEGDEVSKQVPEAWAGVVTRSVRRDADLALRKCFIGCVWGRPLKAVGSRDLADLLDWVQNYHILVERREVPLNEMTGAAGSEGQRFAIPAASAHKTVKVKPPNPPLPISCAVCTSQGQGEMGRLSWPLTSLISFSVKMCSEFLTMGRTVRFAVVRGVTTQRRGEVAEVEIRVPLLSEDGASFKGLGGSTKTLGDKSIVFCVSCESKDVNGENKIYLLAFSKQSSKDIFVDQWVRGGQKPQQQISLANGNLWLRFSVRLDLADVGLTETSSCHEGGLKLLQTDAAMRGLISGLRDSEAVARCFYDFDVKVSATNFEHRVRLMHGKYQKASKYGPWTLTRLRGWDEAGWFADPASDGSIEARRLAIKTQKERAGERRLSTRTQLAPVKEALAAVTSESVFAEQACDDASLLQRTHPSSAFSAPAGLLQELPSVASITFAPGSEWMMGWKRRSPSEKEEPELLRMEQKASLLDTPVIRMLRTEPSVQGASESEDASAFFGLEPKPAEAATEAEAAEAAEPSRPPSLEQAAPKAVPKAAPKAVPKETKAVPNGTAVPATTEPPAPAPEAPEASEAGAAPAAPPAPQSDKSGESGESERGGAPKKPEPAAKDAASWIDIVIGAQTVLHVKNPEEIQATSSDPNPQVATFRTNNVTVEAVPLVPNERLSVSQTLKGNRTLLVEALEALQAGSAGADGRPFPNVATAALAAMEQALSEAALTSRDLEEVEVLQRRALEKSESLDEKAAELSKTLEDIADGVSEASPQQVAKGAEEALRLRGLWQEDQNSSLMAEQEKRELLSQLAEQLSTVVRSGVTALKAVTLGLHLEVNLTAAAATFRALSDESSGSILLPVDGMAGTEEFQRYKKVLLQKLNDIRILPPVGTPLTAEIATSKDGPMTIELVTKNETASDFKALQEDLELASRQLRNATSHVQEMAKEVEAADAAARSLDLVASKKQNLTQELLSIVEATEKLSKGISDFPEGEAGISVATSVANRSAALEEGASKARTVAALLRSAELDFEESLNRSTEATARLAGAGHDAQSQLLEVPKGRAGRQLCLACVQALQASASGLRLANASGAKVDLSGLLELFGKGTLGVAGEDLVPIFRANVTTSQIANLPYDRFFAPASTTSSTKAEEAEAAEAAEAEAAEVPSTSSRQNQREEEDNWMPKAVLFSMACVLSLLVAVLYWPMA